MTGDEDRDAYVARFRALAEECVAELFVPGPTPGFAGGTLEEFRIEDDGHTGYAETVLTFRGHRFRYRRQFWPPDFPLPIKVSLYVEHLRERILTGRYRLPVGPVGTDTTVVL